MQIYLARNQVQAGPYTLTELNNMLATGQVELGDLMWHAGMEQWKPVGEMTQLAQSVPEHLSSMSSLMFLALFAVQLVLLLRKGQTIGKLVTGIRIVDVQSRRLASATNIILWRSLVTSALYVLPMVGPIILIADFVIMVTNKQRRSLHDKFAKTMVVKAKPDQLKK